MLSENSESFIHATRRRQLIRSAIEVIAEVGLDKASTVRIAEHAEVSRGVLTYHFRDRDELIDQVVSAVYDIGAERILPAMENAPGPRAALAAFVGGSIELYSHHATEMTALREIFSVAHAERRLAAEAARRWRKEMHDLEALFTAGQECGEFRRFDVTIMSRTLRGMLDAAIGHLIAGGDIEPYRTELIATVDAATVAGPAYP